MKKLKPITQEQRKKFKIWSVEVDKLPKDDLKKEYEAWIISAFNILKGK